MQKVWVEGLVKALPDPLIATGNHRYQGEREALSTKALAILSFGRKAKKCTCGLVVTLSSMLADTLFAVVSSTMVLMMRIIFLFSPRTWSDHGDGKHGTPTRHSRLANEGFGDDHSCDTGSVLSVAQALMAVIGSKLLPPGWLFEG